MSCHLFFRIFQNDFLSFFFAFCTLAQLGVKGLRLNIDLSKTSHCNIKGFSVSEVMRTENMITQVKFY